LSIATFELNSKFLQLSYFEKIGGTGLTDIRCYPNETTMVMNRDADAMNVFLRPNDDKRNFI